MNIREIGITLNGTSTFAPFHFMCLFILRYREIFGGIVCATHKSDGAPIVAARDKWNDVSSVD